MHDPVQDKGARRYGSRGWEVWEKREVGSRSWGVQWRNGRYRSRGPTSSSPALIVLNNLLKYLQSKAKLCIIIFLRHLRPCVDFIFSKGFVPKSRFKQQNDFAIFFQPKRMLRFTGYGMTHLLYSVMMKVRRFQVAPPCHKIYRVGERDPRGCICPWKITATKRREK